MSRIATHFEALRERHRKALVPYITAGDPEPGLTVGIMHALVEAGADLLELGVPFSDPMADGPVVQAACERALKHHVSLRNVLTMVREFRTRDADTPVVLMGYLNPIEALGYRGFADAAAAAGVDGVLTVDVPPEEAGELGAALHSCGIDPVFLLAPNSPPERLERICAAASGFVYYVSLKGVTGSAALDVASVGAKLAEIRTHTALPIGVGFGIRNAESAARIASVADAVIVGSALVRQIAELADTPERIAPALVETIRGMRAAMDEAREVGKRERGKEGCT